MGINKQTFVNRLRHNAQPLRARPPYVGEVFNHRHRNARIVGACRHVGWTRAMWSRVLFSDESGFNLSMTDGMVRVFRRKVNDVSRLLCKNVIVLVRPMWWSGRHNEWSQNGSCDHKWQPLRSKLRWYCVAVCRCAFPWATTWVFNVWQCKTTHGQTYTSFSCKTWR